MMMMMNLSEVLLWALGQIPNSNCGHVDTRNTPVFFLVPISNPSFFFLGVPRSKCGHLDTKNSATVILRVQVSTFDIWNVSTQNATSDIDDDDDDDVYWKAPDWMSFVFKFAMSRSGSNVSHLLEGVAPVCRLYILRPRSPGFCGECIFLEIHCPLCFHSE